MRDLVCSFTGHRQIKDEHVDILPPLIYKSIEYAYSQGCRSFLAGGAIGFDTYAAREVLRFRMSHRDVRLILVLPCIEQDARWSPRQRDSYQYLVREADEVVYVSEIYTPTCMAQRNRYLAENADMLVAYLSKSASGAGQTVRMVQRLGKPVFNLYNRLEKESQSK